MAVQTTEEFKNGGATSYAITIEYLQTSDVKVRIDGVLQTYVASSPSTGEYTVSGTTVTLGAQAAAGSGNVHIYRETDVNTPAAVFAAGSSIRAADLNAIHDMARFTSVEHRNQVISADIKDGQVTTAKIAADNITSALIADDQINSEHYVADSIDSEHYAPGSVDSAAIGASQVTTNELATDSVNTTKIIDLNVTRAKLEADVIDSTKLADNAVNSEHYIDGSINHVHLANNCIDGDNIQDDVVNSEHIAAGALDNEHYAAGSITSDKLDGATVITASEQGAATTNDTSFLTSAAADARFFNINTGDTIKDGQTFPDNDTSIATTAAINDRIIDLVDDVGGFVPIANETSFPTANPDVNNGAGTIVSIAALASAITTGSGVTTKTIANGAGSGNTVTITGLTASTTYPAGMGMLVETTSVLHTYSFHRLVPKATEVTTVAGISGNVTTVAGIASNVTTVAGISSNVTTVAGNTTNINAVAGNATNINAVAADASDIGVVAADGTDIGLVAGSIANVNNVGGSIASVNSAASNLASINNFGDQYQVNASNPQYDGGGNQLANGDLYFNTTASELKVYNNGAWQSGVTAAGNFASTTGNTFTGDNRYNDNAKALFGTGSDLEIFHQSSNNNSIIKEKGAGTLSIQTNGSTINFYDTANSSHMLNANTGGSVELWHAGSNKFQTASGGVNVTGNITLTGNVDGRDLAADGVKIDGLTSSTGVLIDGVRATTQTASSNGTKVATTAFVATAIANINTDKIEEGNSRAEVIGSGTANGEFKVGLQDFTYTGANKTALRMYQPSDGLNKLELFEDNTSNNATLSIKHIYSGNGTSSLDFTTNDTGRHASIKYWGNLQAIKHYIAGTEKFDIGSNGCHVADKLYCNGGLDTDGDLQFNTGTTNSNVLFDASEGALKFTDNNKAVFGTGDDLEIFHDATTNNSRIKDVGTGVLAISGSDVHIQNNNNSQSIAKFYGGSTNSNVELYHNDSKKLNTNTGGVAIDGNLYLTDVDSREIRFGLGSDFRLFHNGTDSYLKNDTGELIVQADDFRVKNNANNHTQLYCNAGAQVELYYDNTKRFETTSTGVKTLGDVSFRTSANNQTILYDESDGQLEFADSVKAAFGAGSDLEIFHNGNYSYLKNTTNFPLFIQNIDGQDVYISDVNGSNVAAKFNIGAGAELYYDNNKKFETTQSGVSIDGNISAGDNDHLYLGDSQDINIYHDGTDNYFYLGSGTTYFRNASNAYLASFVSGGPIYLYHNGNKKLETTSSGVSVTGDMVASGNVTAYSDRRLKTDISTINDALGIVGKLRGVSYKWLADGSDAIGVIAQEVEEVLPEVVVTNNGVNPVTQEIEEIKSVDYGKIVGVLINAINELKAEVDELKGGK